MKQNIYEIEVKEQFPTFEHYKIHIWGEFWNRQQRLKQESDVDQYIFLDELI